MTVLQSDWSDWSLIRRRCVPRWWLGLLPLRHVRVLPHNEVAGFQLRYENHIEQSRLAEAVRRIDAAIEMIATFDRRRLDRLRRTDTVFLLTDGFPGCAYMELGNYIVLGLQAVETRTRQALATAIVHEATHARIANTGILGNCRNTHRIEQRCVAEEISFVHGYPTSQPDARARWEESRYRALRARSWTLRSRLKRDWRFFWKELRR